MTRSILVAGVVALAALLLVVGPAQGKRKKRHRRRNMPVGHVWPVNKAMIEAGEACKLRLRALGVQFESVKRRKKQIATPIRVPSMELGQVKLTPIWRKGPAVMDCHLAEAIFHTSVAWAAIGVRELRFSSIYQYREVRVNGGAKNVLSRHALGLAIDVYEFVDSAGRVHVVDDHYFNLDLFLPAIEAVAKRSGEFRTVLTPVRDIRSHDDHFHLEARVEYPVERRSRRGRSARKARRRRARRARAARRRRARRARAARRRRARRARAARRSEPAQRRRRKH